MAALDFSRTAPTANPFARVGAFVSATYGALIHWNEARQTRNALSALTDRELDDIGLVRGDIENV